MNENTSIITGCIWVDVQWHAQLLSNKGMSRVSVGLCADFGFTGTSTGLYFMLKGEQLLSEEHSQTF
jgi:hypothetical protein